MLWIVVGINAQIRITVWDENNEPLIGVNVVSDSKSFIESTDLDGVVVFPQNFPIDETLTFTYLSYKDVKITLNELFQRYEILKMEFDAEALSEVVVIGRNQKVKDNTLLPLEIITSKDIAFSEAQTPADLLEKEASVFIQKSQMGGGSPVVRGFEANKVLLVIDGVRMNNAIYRGGHLQNAITIDEQLLGRAEVLYGPGSILYGSDAIGGVLHFRTMTPPRKEEFDIDGDFMLRYASASQEKTIHYHANYGSGKWAGLVGYTYSDYGDLTSGKNYLDGFPDFGKRSEFVITDENGDRIQENLSPENQIGTAYSQQDFFHKLRYIANDKLQFTLNTQYSTSSDVPRYDALTERNADGFRFAEWFYGPQNRLLISPSMELELDNFFFDEMFVIASAQKIDEDRTLRRFGATKREENFEDLWVYGLTVDFNRAVVTNQSVSYGVDWQHNNLSSTSSDNTFTRYPSGRNSMSIFGVYSKYEYNFGKTLNIQAGTRYTYAQTNVSFLESNFFAWPDFFIDGVTNSNSNLSFLGGLYFKKGGLKMNLIGGTAFRSPNIDDLAKTRVNANEISVPNTNLRPEKTWNVEWGSSYKLKNISLKASVFYTQLRDAIVRENFTLPDGSNNYVIDGQSLQVVANVNANTAKVYGISASTEIRFTDKLTSNLSYNYIQGRSFDIAEVETPLGHIPPTYGRASLSYESDKFKTQFVWRFNGEKPIEEFGGSVDNPELATSEGTPGWNTYNLYSNYKLTKDMQLQFGIENLLDIHYRPFASGVSAPGRNFIVSVRYVH
jgi:hemoglobin/transferrin/lactoferrin receptor protein